MTRTLYLTLNPEAVSMAATLRRMAPIAPLVVVKQAALRDLAAELGSMDAALGELLTIAEGLGRPIGINVETSGDTSSTALIAPRGWSEERLLGWAAGHHRELEAEFGVVASVRTEGGAG